MQIIIRATQEPDPETAPHTHQHDAIMEHPDDMMDLDYAVYLFSRALIAWGYHAKAVDARLGVVIRASKPPIPHGQN